MRTGVLVLGYNPNEQNWKRVVWGDPPDQPGRLPRAAAVMLEEKAEVTVITGGVVKEGKSEAWWMKKRLLDSVEELPKFAIYPVLQKVPIEKIRREIEKIVLEEKAKNTTENFLNTGKILVEKKVQKVIIVTSPDHVSRALRDALAIWGKEYPQLTYNLYATPSVTLYSFRTPEDEQIAKIENVIIAEPPTMKKFNISRMFSILNNPEALREIEEVLKRWGK